MSAEAIRYRETAVASGLVLQPPSLDGVTSRLRRAVIGTGDVLMLVGIVLCIPFVILGVAVPVALFVKLVLWLGQLVF
jgi:hypothetical protein